jgi:hypothetical protein
MKSNMLLSRFGFPAQGRVKRWFDTHHFNLFCAGSSHFPVAALAEKGLRQRNERRRVFLFFHFIRARLRSLAASASRMSERSRRCLA